MLLVPGEETETPANAHTGSMSNKQTLLIGHSSLGGWHDTRAEKRSPLEENCVRQAGRLELKLKEQQLAFNKLLK